MKLLEHRRKSALDLCIVTLVTAIALTGCSGESTSTIKPTQSVPSSDSRVDELYAVTPENAADNWVRKDESLFVARLSDGGRLVDGKWERKSDYRYTQNDLISFTAVPDDSRGGSNCVWDGKNLNYRPLNSSNKDDYTTISGKKYVCQIAEDGTVCYGRFEDESYVKSKGIRPAGNYKAENPENELFYFDSFPYDGNGGTDYVWDGYNLKYSPVRKVDSKYVSATDICPEKLAQSDPNCYETVICCRVKPNGRLYDRNVYSRADLPSEDRISQDTVFFLKFPMYLSNADNFIWNGQTLTYDSIHK